MGALRVKEFTRRSYVSSISCFGSIGCARIDTNSGGSLLKTDRGSSAELLGCCVLQRALSEMQRKQFAAALPSQPQKH